MEGAGRTGLAMFNSSKAKISGSHILDSGVHGVCARSETIVSIKNTVILGSKDRGVFVYENAVLEMEGCEVKGTKNDKLSGIQADNTANIMIKNCFIGQNAGKDILITKDVISDM